MGAEIDCDGGHSSCLVTARTSLPPTLASFSGFGAFGSALGGPSKGIALTFFGVGSPISVVAAGK